MDAHRNEEVAASPLIAAVVCTARARQALLRSGWLGKKRRKKMTWGPLVSK